MKIVNLVSQDGELMLHKWWRADEVIPGIPDELLKPGATIILYARFKWLRPDQDGHRVFVMSIKTPVELFNDPGFDLDAHILSMGPDALKTLLLKEQT